MKYLKTYNEKKIDKSEEQKNDIDLDFIKQETFILDDFLKEGTINNLEYQMQYLDSDGDYHKGPILGGAAIVVIFFNTTSEYDTIDIKKNRIILTELEHLENKFESDGFKFTLVINEPSGYVIDNGDLYYKIKIFKD